MTKELITQLEKEKSELEAALNETIEDTIRQAWIPNTLAWIAVVVGGFLLNLLLLVAVAAGR